MEKGNVNCFREKLKKMRLEVREDWLPNADSNHGPGG